LSQLTNFHTKSLDTDKTTTESGLQVFHRVVGSGGSFGASSLQQEIGLGEAVSMDTVTIQWASGKSQTLENPPLNTMLLIREDSDSATVVNLPIGDLFSLSKKPAEASDHSHHGH